MISIVSHLAPSVQKEFFMKKFTWCILMVMCVPLCAQDVSVFVERSLEFEAVIVDQFNNPMPTQDGYEYDWSATGGTLSAVSGSNVMYTAGSDPGDYAVTVSSGAWMDSASIRVVALGNGGTGFIEVAGLLVMEAENHSGSTEQQAPWFIAADQENYVGEGYMTTHDQVSNGAWGNSDELSYACAISHPGDYHLWMRVQASGGSSNSCFVGMDGVGLGTFDNSGHTGWTWIKHTQTINLSGGQHEFHIQRRESGYHIDRILLTSDANMVPAGEGPPESLRTGPDTSKIRTIILSHPPGFMWESMPAGSPTYFETQTSIEDLDPENDHTFSVMPAAQG